MPVFSTPVREYINDYSSFTLPYDSLVSYGGGNGSSPYGNRGDEIYANGILIKTYIFVGGLGVSQLNYNQATSGFYGMGFFKKEQNSVLVDMVLLFIMQKQMIYNKNNI